MKKLSGAQVTSVAFVAVSLLIFASPAYSQRAPGGSVAVVRGIEGTSQLDNCALNQCFYPPSPGGAIGTAQFLEATNGSITVYDKASGSVLSRVSMVTFWNDRGLIGGSNGNQRVLFDHYTNRWIISGFGPTTNKVNLAISDTADALGTWKAVQITVLASGTAFADNPTLALDDKGVYLATNNFEPGFTGTTLMVIPKVDLFTGTPTLANMTVITTLLAGANNGFTIQPALNWQGNLSNTAAVIAESRGFLSEVFYTLNGVNAAGATQTPSALITGSGFVASGTARQPDGTRYLPTLGGHTLTNSAQVGGKVFYVSTVKSGLGDYAAVRWTVLDASTGALLSSGKIEQLLWDYYQGAIAVNEFGEVVIAYNRSGFALGDGNGDTLDDGNISFLARAYKMNGNALEQTGAEMLLRVSPVSDYHCDPRALAGAGCPHLWGFYSAVTFDPSDHHRFYALGAYAADWAELPLTGGLVRSVWHTYIAEIAITPPPELVFSNGFE